MQLIRRTWHFMIGTISLLLLLTWLGTIYITHYISYNQGAVSGYNIGLQKAEMSSPLKPYVESGKPFCFDNGITYTVRKSKKSFIPEFK